MSDTLYAFDADTGVQLWSVNFASSVGATPVPYAHFAFAGNSNIVGNLGILSTPVIDSSTNILYLVACTLENGNDGLPAARGQHHERHGAVCQCGDLGQLRRGDFRCRQA